MEISDGMKNEIMLEPSKFTAAEVPYGLSEENKVIVKCHLNKAFIGAFNKVVYVASLLCLLGTVIALIFIKGKMPGKEN
jgi:hypothetical protein